ncbi:MAG: right-handed parallel beta-helix repeat-containing protein, partial [Melioribacteraceae bacterium]|nr:right-handed parallel beta-helix repeat-containing protein [Melioribacteraceae bacterium]
RMYSLDGDSTFRKEWTQIKTLDLDKEPANMAVFVNKTIPASSPKGIREIAGDYRTGTLYKSKKEKGTEITYIKLKPKVKVQLTTSVLPAEAAAGGCTVSPSGGDYDKNASVSISANAASGWVFDNWSGDLTGSANPSSLTMSSDKNVIGNFKPVLELNFNSVDAQNIKVPKNDEKIHIGSAYLTAGGVDWEFKGITFTALEKIKPINARAFINYDGNTKEGTFSLDSEGYISEINFALLKIIPEDYTLIVSFYYMFDFPLSEKDLLAPLDEIKKLGISYNRYQVACDPVISVQGVKVPADNFTSNYQTMGWIWNTSLTPHKPFVTFQEAIDDSKTKDGDTIEVWKGYYKYASAINISKPLSFIADDGAANTLIEVENTLPTKGSVTSSATNVSFDGFTILGNDEDFGVLSTSTITIKNSTIRDCGKAAVFLNGDGILTINNCKIWSNAGDGLAFGSSDWENKNYYLIIEGNGTEIISNTGNGIKSFGGDIRIFGTNNKVYGNSEWGIKSMSGDIYINDDAIASIYENGKGGIITPNDARIPKGFIIENNDGPGLVVLGASSLILENIKIKNNKGDAIGFGVPSWPTGTTDLLIRGTENVITNNEGNGIYITSGNLVIEGTNTKIDGNTGWGIKSMGGSIAIKENAMTYISNNSKGGIICAGEGDVTIPQNFTIENNGGPGLVSMGATKPLNLKNIKIKNNGGDGIGFQMQTLDDSDTSPQLIIYGANNEIINNNGNGIISFGANILISGSGTQIHDNTGWGIRSNQGGITINNGSMQSVNSNGKGGIACLSEGKLELPSNFIIENNSGPGIIVYDEKPISFWSIKVKNNLGHGLISMSKDLYIWGGSEFINNTGNGIYSRFSGNVTISGKDIDISDNHNWGVVVENGNGNIDGTSQSRVKLNNNLDGGVWVQNGKLKSRNINVLSNLGDGIRCAKKIFVGQAKICSNTGKGIVSGGTTTLEQVNICENTVTGVYVTPTISYADLAVEISGTESPINVNENIVYNIIVTNNGPDLAHGVMMKNPLPVGLSFVKVSSSNGESYEQDGTVYCDIGALTNGSSINIELTTSASNGGTFINSASIESGMIDNDKNNNIASITTIVTSPLTAFLSGYETDKQSKFIKKNYPQESSTHLSYISNYILNYPTAYSPIEDDEYSQSKISGSIIEGNKNGGILYDSESEIVVDNSNIIGNSPYGLKNNISTATITATNNYWGNSAGPSIGAGISNGVIGNVNISDWLNSRVALTVAAEIDTVLITKNMVDTVFCFFQNWDNINDVVKVDITESENWISNSTSFSINLHNGSASSPIIINTPVDATSSELNKVFITGISQTNFNDTQIDSFVVKVYKPVSTTISIIPDSIVIGKGDTLQFSGTVKDQFGNLLEPNLKWEASSSTISDSGLFIADSTEGVVEITAIDLTTSLKAKTSILINSNKRVLSGIALSPDSLIIMPNHDFIFKANGFDKDGFSINFEAVWTTDGGVIDSLGHFVADESLGYFTIEVSDTSGNIKGYSYIEIALLTSVEKENVIPKQYSLNQNYPNPFNPSTTISYALPYDSKVRVEIFNVLGQRVGVIANGVESAGLHSTLWDATHLASGIYIIRINATSVSSSNSFTKSIKMILMK